MAAGSLAGLAVGASAWDREDWCQGTFTGTFAAGAPGYIAEVLSRAKECNIRVVVVWPRRMQTVNGENDGKFSVSASNRLGRPVCPAACQPQALCDSGHFVGFLPLDDMGCPLLGRRPDPARRTSRRRISMQRAKLPGIPLGIRVIPA